MQSNKFERTVFSAHGRSIRPGGNHKTCRLVTDSSNREYNTFAIAAIERFRMAFSILVAEDLCLRCQRRCCICHKFKGTAIEVHHIDPDLKVGRDDADNGIPLCFDCHGMVGHYNTAHPRGRRYRPAELRKLRDQWFEAVARHGIGASEAIKGPAGLVRQVQQRVNGNDNIVTGGDLLINTRKVSRTVFSPGPQHVSESTAYQIKKHIDELVELESCTRNPALNPYAKWWSKLQRQFKVTTYKAIPCEQSERVIQWLQKQKALLRPKLRRASNETWRQQYYKAICTRSQQIGIDKPALLELAQTKLGLKRDISSLTELGERDLQRLHQIIFAQ